MVICRDRMNQLFNQWVYPWANMIHFCVNTVNSSINIPITMSCMVWIFGGIIYTESLQHSTHGRLAVQIMKHSKEKNHTLKTHRSAMFSWKFLSISTSLVRKFIALNGTRKSVGKRLHKMGWDVDPIYGTNLHIAASHLLFNDNKSWRSTLGDYWMNYVLISFVNVNATLF